MKRIITIGAMLILLVSCKDNNPAIVKTDSISKTAVKVVKSETRVFKPFLELPGTAFADREANLGAALPGRVEKIYFPEGSNVGKGDLLVSLSGELYTQALTEFNALEKDYERVSRLNEKGSISKQDYDHVKAMYDASRSKVAMMRKNAEIVAPFSGTIIEYLVNEGENYFFNLNFDPGYSNTSGILRLMRLDPLQVEVEVNEKDLVNITTGQKALITFDGTGEQLFTGFVSSVRPVLSVITHTATVKIEIRNSNHIIKPGMFGHVKIELNPVTSVSVPLNAIYRQPGTSDDYLFIVNGDTVRRVRVERLWTDSDVVGIEGVEPGLTIVTSGKEKLHDGSLIEIK